MTRRDETYEDEKCQDIKRTNIMVVRILERLYYSPLQQGVIRQNAPIGEHLAVLSIKISDASTT
jgi:hypothetical protein